MMFVIIKDRLQFNRYLLDPQKDASYKGITIYHRHDGFYIALKENYYFSDHTKIRKAETKRYEVVVENSYYVIELFIYENEKGIDDYKLYENRNLIIASSEKADIICRDPYLKDKYLILRNGCLESNYEVLLNGRRYDGRQLKPEDTIDYLGIRIVYYDEFLYINSFCCSIRLKEYPIQKQKIRYVPQIDQPSYHLPLKIHDLQIAKLKEFNYQAPKEQELSRVILPNIVMSLSISSIAALNFYNSLLRNQEPLGRIAYLIMPIGMIVTGVFLPMLFHATDKVKEKKAFRKARDAYLAYLEEYHKDLETSISIYRQESESLFFDATADRNKMFYADQKSGAYLKLSLGRKTMQIPFPYEKTNDDMIDGKLVQIASVLSSIPDIPVDLSLQKYRIVTIVSPRSMKRYHFQKFLLEITCKHHFDDIYVAIYAKDPDLLRDVYNLPHLFFQKKRLTLNSSRQIRELDQNHFDRDLILFVYDKLDHSFSNPRIHVLYFCDDLRSRYKNSEAIVEYGNQKACLYENEIQEFHDPERDIDFKAFFHYLGRFNNYGSIQNRYRLSAIFKDFDIETSYRGNRNGLRADFAYVDHEVLSLDLHEAKQGPHGLIGGATGSGKSELIVSMLLSLCIRYSPDYLNIILIDYKGGGIMESLCAEGRSLPHIIASISNLENHVLERLIIALHNECHHREALFKKLSRESHASIMNIDDYLDSDHERFGLDKIAHQLIVVDEFAQLKKEHPEQIKELISISRIGRSLGIHLILATQRPSGNIDEEIWSNSRFKLSLKVFEERDSLDIVKNKDAAYLQNPGEFLLKVDESLIHGQSVYSKFDIGGNDPIRISLLDHTLTGISSLVLNPERNVSEAAYYVSLVNETCKRMNLKSNEFVYLPPKAITRRDCPEKGKLVFGLKDDYHNGIYEPLRYDSKDNLLICSMDRLTIDMLLNELNDLKRRCIVIANERYQNASITDSLVYEEEDDLIYLFEHVLMNDPDVTIVIEDLNAFLSYRDDYLDLFIKAVRRSEALDHSFIVLCSTVQLSYRILNLFKKKILINSEDRNDVGVFFARKSRYQGNSFYMEEEPVTFIPFQSERFMYQEKQVNSLISRIPEKIAHETRKGEYLAGYELSTRRKIYMDTDVLIVSYQQDLLNVYHEAYPEVKTCRYDYSRFSVSSPLLWLGPGLFNQRLFLPELKYDLQYNEGILIDCRKTYHLRCIDE